MGSIVLIDDKREQVEDLRTAIATELKDQVDIKIWVPTRDDVPRKVFDEMVSGDTTLVVTDYDLTSLGQTGLFGSTIVAWCQQKAIPVADYSRANPAQLPKYPDLFELRVPSTALPSQYVAGVYRGFEMIRDAIGQDKALLNARSASAILAAILGEPELESDFALYALRIGPASGALMTAVTTTASEDVEANSTYKREVLSFIAGHLLLNAVLRFPGPILSLKALGAYLATDSVDESDLQELFESATYSGPFSQIDKFYWLTRVDEVLDSIVPDDIETATNGELHRIALERKLSRELRKHSCSRCNGQNGGFYCPFTSRTICSLSSCSVGSNSWIPQGARVSRIERDYFDEWAPVFGL
jgi:hypothetical protein